MCTPAPSQCVLSLVSHAAQHLSSFQIPLDHPHTLKCMHAGGKLCVCAVVFFNTSKIYDWTQLEKKNRRWNRKKRKTHTQLNRSENEFIFQFVVLLVHSIDAGIVSLSRSLPPATSYIQRICFTGRAKYQDYHNFLFWKKFIVNEVSAMDFDIFVYTHSHPIFKIHERLMDDPI